MAEFVESELPDIEYLPVAEIVSANPSSETTPKRRGRPPGSSNKVNLAKMQEELADKLVEATAPLAVISPLAGAVIDERAERTAKALVTIAGNSPRFKRALDKALKASAYWDIAMLPFAVSVAIMVDFGRLEPTSVVATKFHIDKHWSNLYEEGGSELGSNNGNGFVSSKSGLFQ